MELEASPCSRNYRTSGIRRKQQRSINTNCSKAPTQHQLSHFTDTLKTELQRGTRQMKNITADKKKDGRYKRYIDNSNVVETKHLLIRNNRIDGKNLKTFKGEI